MGTEDYVRYSLRHLKGLAEKHRVPVLLSVDVARWWKTHPILSQATYEASDARWTVHRAAEGWRAVSDASSLPILSASARQGTIWEYVDEPRTIEAAQVRYKTPIRKA